MTYFLFPMDRGGTTAGRFLRSLLVNALINTAIAVMLTGIGFSGGFAAILINSQCIGFSIYFCFLLTTPLYKKATGPFTRIAVVMSAVIVGSITGAMLGAFANGMGPLLYIRKYSMYFSRAVLVGLFFGSIIIYVLVSLEALSQEKIKRLDLEKSAAETELKLLQSQMEPHFLFNTLSNVMGLIERDPDKARRMLESFTSFLRASFMTARDRTVTLAHEADVVKNYLDVFALRMGGRLQYRIDIPDELREFRIPPLLIQPLVENAVKHGLEPAREGGTVSVRARLDGNFVRISVADTGIGLNEKSAGAGIGLENIRMRLNLVYGERGRLIVEENTPAGIIVSIVIPL